MTSAYDYAPSALPIRWDLLDYLDKTATTPPAAGGRCEATLDVPPDVLWLVDRMVVSCSSSTATAALMYVGDESPQNLRDGSDAGNLDFTDAGAALTVRPSMTLRCVWTGASTGAVGRLAVQARVMRQSRSL